MTSLAKFSQLALGKSVVENHSPLPDSKSPGVTVTALFTQQSYFDDTLLERAILTQSVNEPIVGSTLRQEQIGGYALALHPNSQTPVAVQPLVGGQPASPQATILRPGQIYRPHGRPDGVQGNFSGFRWGLPFGWLGGGVATLYVLPSADAQVDWPGTSPEIVFQRQRIRCLAPASLPTAARKNWPLRFPWTQAVRGSSNITQAGAAIVGIAESTKVEMSLRLTSLGAPATMRILFHETNDMDLDSTGAVIAGQARFIDYTWEPYAVHGGANLATAYPVVEFTGGPLCRLAADDGGIALADLSVSTLSGAYLDVVRYGRL